MKKNLIALVAVVAAITLSSFTTQRATVYFLQYDIASAGDQRFEASYFSPVSIHPAHQGQQVGTQVLNWVKVIDQDDLGIEDADVLAAYNLYNATSGSQLNNEVDITDELDITDL